MVEGLTDKQSVALCDAVGKMLVLELDSKTVKDKVKTLVADYVKKNKLSANPAALAGKIHWHVEALLEK